MITNGLLSLGWLVLHWIVNLFPLSTGFPTEVHTALETIGGYASIFNPIFPYQDMGIIIGILVGVEVGIFVFKTMRWGIGYLPFVGGKK